MAKGRASTSLPRGGGEVSGFSQGFGVQGSGVSRQEVQAPDPGGKRVGTFCRRGVEPIGGGTFLSPLIRGQECPGSCLRIPEPANNRIEKCQVNFRNIFSKTRRGQRSEVTLTGSRQWTSMDFEYTNYQPTIFVTPGESTLNPEPLSPVPWARGSEFTRRPEVRPRAAPATRRE